MDLSGIDLDALLDSAEKVSLIVVGALLTLGTSAIAERRTDRRAAAAMQREDQTRIFELGREHAADVRRSLREVFDTLTSLNMGQHASGFHVPLHTVALIRERAALIPNELLRNAVDSTSRLLEAPDQFEGGSYAEFVAPVGPAGIVPPIAKQILLTETLIEMLSAFLREEDPHTEINPLMELALERGRGRGLTARNMFAK